MKPKVLGKKSSLSNEHWGRFGDVEVVDVMLSRGSIYGRLNGYGIWPSKETLKGLVLRQGYPEEIRSWVKLRNSGGVIFRLYVETSS